MVTYRPIPDDRLDEFRSYTSYAFIPETGPYDPDEELPASARMGEPRGLFADDELRSGCKQHFFDLRVADQFVPAAGLAAVATPPEHRRKGLVRALLRESLAEYRDREVAVSVLWPFEHPFYAQFGWRIAEQRAVHECDPDALGFARDHASGRFHRIETDEWERLVPAYEAHGGSYNLTLDRSEEWWRYRILQDWETDPYAYAWERDGEIRGYLVYDVQKDQNRHLRVREHAFTDHEARLNLLRFLADHDSQVSTVQFTTPIDERAVDLVSDPADISIEVTAGPMVRLVDVERTFETATYPADASADAVISVADPLAAWNDATFRIAVEAGRASVERVEAADPDATIDVGTLSQLYVGYRSVDDAVRTGDADVSPAARELLSAFESPTSGYLRDQF